MSFCTACGHERTGPGRFCTTCGAPLAPEPDTATPLATAAPAPPEPPTAISPPAPGSGADEHDPYAGLYAPPGRDRSASGYPSPPNYAVPPGNTAFPGPGGSPPDMLAAPSHRRSRAGIFAVAAALVVLAAGGGAAAWVIRRHDHSHARPPVAAQSSGTGQTDNTSASPVPSSTVAPTSPPAVASSPPPASASGSPPAPPGGTSILTVAPGVGQDSRAPLVESFLNSYFAAINTHDYQQYRALLDRRLQRNLSAQSFTDGYSSTSDSAATLTSISGLGGGEVGAAVTFTSHQDPSQSPTQTSCTHWSIILYLTIHDGRYLLGHAPAGYRAGYQGC
jgi:hypothetical protein